MLEFRQVYFLAPLLVRENEEKEVRTILKTKGDHFEFSIESPINTATNQWQKHAWGEVAQIKTEPPQQYDLNAIKARCQEVQIPDNVQSQVSFVEFGPRWQISLKQIKLGKNEGLVRLELPEIFAADVESYQLHPALLDSAGGLVNVQYFYPSLELNLPSDLSASTTGFMKNKGVYYMPFSYSRLKIQRALPRQIYSYVRFPANLQSEEGIQKVNLTIMDEQGLELLEIEDYLLREVNLEKLNPEQILAQNEKINMSVSQMPDVERSSIPASDKTDGQVPLDSDGSERNTWMTNRLQQNIQEGLLPADGIEVFSRLLNNELPQVIISTRDLRSRLEQNRTSTLLSSTKESDLVPLPQSAHPRPQLSHTYVAPRNKLEQTITEIWQKFLGLESVGIHDDFFELGGDSLLAVQVIFKLRETLQMDLSAHALLNEPTIAALVESIEKTTSVSGSQPAQTLPSSLIEIKKGDGLLKTPPLFLIPPLGGHVYFYRDLANCLKSEQPVYGFQAQGLDGKEEPFTQLEEIANQYIEMLLLRQPNGPYFLGGTSSGGLVAFEMAQQLRKLGREISLLFMIDTLIPEYMLAVPKNDVEMMLNMLTMLNPQDKASLEDEIRKLNHDEQLIRLLERGKMIFPMFSDWDLTQIRNFLHVSKINIQAIEDYIPQVYPGRLIFFRATELHPLLFAKNPERAWLNLVAGGLDIHDVPGDHITMNSPPHVEVIAKLLKTYLDKG
jgi:thioesterase domain-containing protein/acyl carrier protein